MTAKLTAPLRAAPATVPALAAIALFIAWATDQAGYPVTHWGPGGLIVLGLLAVAVLAVGLHAGEISTAVKIALACLAGYTALSFLSITWAVVPGDAWEGANRTLLYLLVFALFACWRQRGQSAALLLGVWTLALIGLAAYAAVHLDASSSAALTGQFPGGRLIFPSGYANANAALWLMAFWPALLLARSARLPWALRGVLAGGAVLLAEVALLSQSRGSLYATPVMLVLVFAFLPGRVRTFLVLVPIAAGIAAAAPAVLHVGDHLSSGAVVAARVHSAAVAMFAAALVVAAVVSAGAVVERRNPLSEEAAGRVRARVGALAAVALVVVLAGGLIVAGHPLARVRHAWDTFKSPHGYAANSSGSRLVSGLGSYRYDFYRVSLNEFIAHPIVGIGADNFQQQYLAHRRSYETPHYPHSVELRTLTQTGLLGALLAVVGLGAALLAGMRACRGADPLARAVATAALAAFAYWAVHGSFDWFWEFAGLGAPAFALLGLACALDPFDRVRRVGPIHEPLPAPARPPRRSRVRVLAGTAGVIVVLACAASLAAPWLSQMQVERAARIWTTAPLTAYSSLDDAARLNPLSDEAYLVAGSIALRYGELAHADREFALALSRTPGDAYATLERGAIASADNRRQAALALLERAVALDPREPLALQALHVVQGGGRVSVEALNLAILGKARQFS
ncbi:MAG TPA: O-antigen ligase family protein [Solirubrobacteraceae bacterium]|jgi:tetratricopeptide (TPR) repeat protein|nr:O-antigen ligase family protein [Solirubrobacteraceae bacterium]